MFSPNGKKLAVATSDRQIYIFDDKLNRRDKFSTKPSDSQVFLEIVKLNFKIKNFSSAKRAIKSVEFVFHPIRQNWPSLRLIILLLYIGLERIGKNYRDFLNY